MRRGILFSALVLFSILPVTSRHASAHEAALTGWSTDHREAWRNAQAKQLPMLLYISSDNCVYCKKMVHDTLTDKSVAQQIQQQFVPVNLAAKDNRLLVRKLRVKSYPTTVIISPRSVVLDYIPGFVSANEMKMRLVTATHRLADNRR